MLETFYPYVFRRYLSLTVLGPVADGFAAWLVEQGYNQAYTKQMIWLLPHIEAFLVRRGIRQITNIDPAALRACRKSLLRRFPYQQGIGCTLERYLRLQNLLKPEQKKELSSSEKYLAAYTHYLETVRGVGSSAIRQSLATVASAIYRA